MRFPWRWQTLLFITAAMVLSYILWNPSSVINLSPNLSVRNTEGKGAKAYYLLLERLEFEVKLSESPLSSLSGDWGVLISLSPQKEIGMSEAEHLMQWLTGGGTIIMADANQNTIFRKTGIIPYMTGNDPHPQEIVPIPCSLTAGVSKVQITSNWRLKFNNSFSRTILLVDERGTIAASLAIGKGHLIILSTPELFSNELIGQSDNSVFCVNMASAGFKRVCFDEFHHGFSTGRNIFTLLNMPVKLSLIQLFVITLLFLVAKEKNYSAPQMEDGEEERKSMEYIRSIAQLLQRSNSGSFCLGLLYKNFRRDLAMRTGSSSETPHARLASLYAAKTGCNESALLMCLDKCNEAIKKKKLDNALVLRLAGEMEAFRKGEGWKT
jgi:hypothetical protein